MIIIQDNQGTRYEGETPLQVIYQMKLDDWSDPASCIDYKARVQTRSAAIEGITFVYWDASSFLMGMQECGLIRILKWGVKP